MQILAREIKAGDVVYPARDQTYKIKVNDVEIHGQTVVLFFKHPFSGESSIYRKHYRTLVKKD